MRRAEFTRTAFSEFGFESSLEFVQCSFEFHTLLNFYSFKSFLSSALCRKFLLQCRRAFCWAKIASSKGHWINDEPSTVWRFPAQRDTPLSCTCKVCSVLATSPYEQGAFGLACCFLHAGRLFDGETRIKCLKFHFFFLPLG